MNDLIVSSLLTRCFDPGDSAGKIKLRGKALHELTDDQLHDYMAPWYSTLGDARAVVLYDELPSAFIDRWRSDRCQFLCYPADASESAWVARYRMLEAFLADRQVGRVLFTDINDVAFASNPFAWLDAWGLPLSLIFGEELTAFGRNNWFSGEALSKFPQDIAAWFHESPETKPLSAGLWGGFAASVLDLCRGILGLCDQHAQRLAEHRSVAWDMVFLNYLAGTTLDRFATFGMHLAKPPHALAGITLRSGSNPNAVEHNTQRARAIANGVVSWNRGSPASWEQLGGWFDFQRLYDEAVDRAYMPSVFVEVGCWLGKSTAYMGQRLRDRDRKVDFFAVDTWKGSPNQAEMVAFAKERGGDLFTEWQRNMDRCNVLEYVTPLRLDSVEAAQQFEDQSVDFCFIDGDHSYEAVKADLLAWLPKMKPTSVLAGHDYDMEGVRRAVREVCPKHRTWDKCWIVDLSAKPA